MIAEEYNNNITPLAVSLCVCEHNGQPAIEIRRLIKDMDLIKQIILAANYEKTILVLPVFRDKLRARASLIQKGIIYEKNNQCHFNF